MALKFSKWPWHFRSVSYRSYEQRHCIEAGSLLSMRLKWCTFQPCKVQLPTRKLLLWQMSTVRMNAILFYSTNMMWCFIYHIKRDSSGKFPLTLLNQFQKLYFALLQGYRSSDDQPIPLNTHLYGEANLLLVGWLPGQQFPSGNHQSDMRHTDPLCCRKSSPCTLHFWSLSTVQHTGKDRSWGDN